MAGVERIAAAAQDQKTTEPTDVQAIPDTFADKVRRVLDVTGYADGLLVESELAEVSRALYDSLNEDAKKRVVNLSFRASRAI